MILKSTFGNLYLCDIVTQWDDEAGVPDCGHLSRYPAQDLRLAVCRQN